MIPLCIPEIKGNEWKYLKDCLDTNWVSSVGSYVNLFEEKFKNYINTEKAVVTVNGTSALHLALISLGIKQDDEIIVPSLTFVAPVNAIRYINAKPVFVDVCKDTYVMNTDMIEELITEKTKAILPVHIYGHPVDMDVVMNIAQKHNLYVIEDATESLGSLYKGKPIGTMGHVGCFSFNGNKLITTGAGGMLVTNDSKLGDYAKHLSNQSKAISENGGIYHDEIGYNYRMPNIVAAMGVAQLEMVDEYVQAKRKNADLYNKLLSNTKGITVPTEKQWATNVHWLYSILVEDEYKISRDMLIKELKSNGVESRPFFMPLHNMPPFADCKVSSMNNTDYLEKHGLCLPSSVGLKVSEIETVCNIIKSFE